MEISMEPFFVDEQNPENSIPTPELTAKHPLQMGYLMMALTEHADAETKRGNHEMAARYWLALAKGTPTRSVGMVKACASYAAAKAWDKAADACAQALGRGGATVGDQVRYVQVMLERKGALDSTGVEAVTAVLSEVERAYGADPKGKKRLVALRCRLAVNQTDAAGLEACAQAVQSWPAKDPERVLFATAAAVNNKDWDRAEQIVEDAGKAGLPAPLLAQARAQIAAQKTLQSSKAWDNFKSHWAPVLGVAVALALLGLVLRSRRPKARLA
jgi:hypothetical protein